MTEHEEIEIREVVREEDFLHIAEIQKVVWGFAPADVAAPHLIMLHQKLGGVVLGAFDREDRIVAFCYSFYGLMGKGERRTPIQWSHMLAVLPEYRGRGLGKKLKWKQREMILERGVTICRWTFDPLETLNARLNIVTLGCVAKEYLFNLYGSSTGHLHEGLPTDRFVAHWQLDSERVAACAIGKPRRTPVAAESLPLLFDAGDAGGVVVPQGAVRKLEDEYIGVPVPGGIQEMKLRNREAAVRWRGLTGEVFPELFERGYTLVDVLSRRETGKPVSIYILQKEGL